MTTTVKSSTTWSPDELERHFGMKPEDATSVVAALQADPEFRQLSTELLKARQSSSTSLGNVQEFLKLFHVYFVTGHVPTVQVGRVVSEEIIPIKK